MESPSISSSSRVKVEYTDPSGIYPLLSGDLISRIPLRNLHWNSPTRPLRSIDNLYVELVPDDKNLPISPRQSVLSQGLREGLDSTFSPGLPPDARKETDSVSRKERRHQIPGLRQTPYLKLYLLLCDDVEAYKASSRKILREWVKAHTPPSQSSTPHSSQESHDAFDWMILHIVLLDAQSNSVWPSRNSLAVLEKIRADFNGTSKSAVDRVAQIPTFKGVQVQGATVNPIPSGPARHEFLKEAERAWEDFLGKIKTSILASFDLRVRQYEEDIKEKSSQRNLPGWNFCTFFVLKEGLARGFESVGLVEDALMGYDELALELEIAIRDQKQKSLAGSEPELFQEHTKELRIQTEAAFASSHSSDFKKEDHKRANIMVLDAERKPFRELILANNISMFDFQSYVFARQVALLSRIANLHTINESSQSGAASETSSKQNSSDLTVVAEICRRAIQFVTSTGSVIREDLRASFKADASMGESTLALRYGIIENIVASWTFSSCNQVLLKTEEESLKKHIQLLTKQATSPLSSPRVRSPLSNGSTIPKLSVTGLSGFPNRTSSLLAAVSLKSTSPSPSEQLAFSQKGPHQAEAHTGLEYLAAQRAEMYLIARRALSSVGTRHGWKTGWSAVSGEEQIEESDLDEVSLEDGPGKVSTNGNLTSNQSQSVLVGLQDDDLEAAMSTRNGFYALYEDLTVAATQLYQVSGDQKSANTMVGDLAIARFSQDDFAAAAGYFHHLAPFYAQDDWSELEISVLDMYAQCLQKLGRKSDYVRIALKIVAKEAQRQRRRTGLRSTRSSKPITGTIQRRIVDTYGYLENLLSTSKDLKEIVTTPLKRYFVSVRVDPHVRHFEDKDGFGLEVNVHHVMYHALEVRKLEIRLVSTGAGQARDIWLSSPSWVSLAPGRNRVSVLSNVLVYGWYTVDKIRMEAENIVFLHDFSAIEGTKFFNDARDQVPVEASVVKESRILVWPSSRACELQVSLFPDIHLEKPKSILFEVSSGHNSVSGGKIVVRAGSAGLRILTADAQIMGDGSGALRTSETGVVHFEEITPQSMLKIQIPYKLENDIKEIAVRAEVCYSTPQGEFVFACSKILSVLLPLGVNVQDVFKHEALFSKFAISSSTSVPLRVLDCVLEGTDDFEATSPKVDSTGLLVSPKQPVSVVYRIVPKTLARAKRTQTKLSLHIDYVCLDDEIVAVVKKRFMSSLEDREFVKFLRLLLPVLVEFLHGRFSAQELETVGLLREFELGVFQDYDWERVLVTLPEEQKQTLAQWLLGWHEKHAIIDLPDQNEEGEVRTITIPVEVPQMHVIHTARLHVGDLSQKSPSEPLLVGLGDAIPAELALKSSYIWDSREVAEGSQSEEYHFCYEFEANPDLWIIGGQRKAYFTTKNNEIQTFPLLLIPQRVGHLVYPSLEIRHVDDPYGHGSGTASHESITSDMDYQNQGESLQVIPNLRSTTVSLDPDNSMAGSLLLESQPRRGLSSSWTKN